MLKRLSFLFLSVLSISLITTQYVYGNEKEGEPDLTSLLMDVSGINKSTELLPEMIRYELLKGSDGENLPVDKKEIIKIIGEAVDAAEIKDKYYNALHEKLLPDEKKDIILWYGTETGKKVVEHELRALIPDEIRKKDEFALDIRNLQVSPARGELLRKYEKSLKLEEHNADIANTLNEEVADGRISKSDIREASNRMYITILHKFRDLTDEELEAYVTFIDSDSGKKFVELTNNFEKKTTLDLMRKVAGAAVKSLATGSGTLTFEDLNFKLDPPGKEWIKLDAKKINPEASLYMYKAKPGIGFLIIAEKLDAPAVFESNTLLEINKANLESGSEKIKIYNENKYTVNGLKGIRYSANATIGKQKLYYSNWVYSGNGYLFQILSFGDQKDKRAVNREFKKLMQGFTLIDSEKSAFTQDLKHIGNFSSPLFQYDINLKGKNWTIWDDIEEYAPEAEIGGIKNSACFIMAPVYYGNNKPKSDAVFEALLKFFEIEMPDKEMSNILTYESPDSTGYTFDYQRDYDDGETLIYKFKIIIKSRAAYLFCIWAPEVTKDLSPLTEELLDSMKFAENENIVFDINKLDKNKKEAHADFYNYVGIYYYREKQYDKSLEFFTMACEFNRQHETYLLNALRSYSALGRYSDALSYLMTRIDNFPDNLNFKSWEAWLLNQTGEKEKSVTLFKELFDKGYREDEDFISYVGTLAEFNKWDEVEKSFAEYLKEDVSLSVYVEQARLKRAEGKYDEAISIMEEQQKNIPFNFQIAFEIIQNYRENQSYKDILKITDELIKNDLYPADAYYYKGEAEYYLKWYREAKKSLEKSLEYNPKDDEVKNFIMHISGLLGEGNNTSIKKEITPVKLPEEIEIKGPYSPGEYVSSEYGAYYISRIIGLSYEKDAGQKITIYEKIRILDSSGVIKFSTIEKDFNPLYEDIYVNKIVIYDEKGEAVSQVDPSDFYVIDSQNSYEANHVKTLNIPVQNLKPGYLIELVYTIKKYDEDFIFFASCFSKERPVLYSAIFYKGNFGDIRYLTSGEPVKTEMKDGLLWYMEKPAIYKWEPLQPYYEEFLPMLWIVGSKQDWAEIGKDYLEEIKDKLTISETTRAYAEKLTYGLDNDVDRIKAIINDLQTNYIYKAIEFGRRASIPNTCDETIDNRYGDCKDHALLLHILLKSISIESSLALVNSGGHKIKKDLPDMDQFNHMIVYLPEYKGGIFIDPTDKRVDSINLVPTGLAGSQALILDPDNISFKKIPDYIKDVNGLKIERKISVSNNREVNIEETVRFNGHYAGFMRENLIKRDKIAYKQWLQNIFSSYLRSVSIQSFDVKNLLTNSEDLIFEITYRLTDQSKNVEDKFSLKVPNVWEENYLENEPVDNRATDFHVYYPFSINSSSTLVASPGFLIKDGQSMDKQTAFGRAVTMFKNENSEYVFELLCEMNTGRFDKKKYSDYVDFFIDVIEQSKPEIILVNN